jgi:hypothetical protein
MNNAVERGHCTIAYRRPKVDGICMAANSELMLMRSTLKPKRAGRLALLLLRVARGGGG